MILSILPNAKNVTNLFLKIVRDIKGNGKVMSDMDMESRHGQMELNMKATGRIIRLMAKELSGMCTATSMKEHGSETKHMDSGGIHIATVPHTKATGKMTYNTDKVSNSGTIIQNTKVSIKEEKNMVTEFIFGRMGPST